MRPRPLPAGATAWCRTPCLRCNGLRARLDLDLVALELEDVEVTSRYVDGDVVHRDRPDRTLEAAGVRMAVEDDVGPVLRDRRREAVAPEVRPDSLRLAVERVRGRRIVQEHDADGTVRDLLEPLVDGVDLRCRLRVDLTQQRLTEIRKCRAGEAADEAFRPDDAHLAAGELAHRRGTVEHVQPGTLEDRRDLVAATRVQVVVAEDRADRNAKIAARVGQHLRLFQLTMRRQIAGEEDEIDLLLDRGERLFDPRTRRL